MLALSFSSIAFASSDPCGAPAQSPSSPWEKTYDVPSVVDAVPPASVVEWLKAGKINALVDVRTRQEFEGLGGYDVPACTNDATVTDEKPACKLGHANLAVYSASAPYSLQVSQSKSIAPLQVIFCDSLATVSDEAFLACFGGAKLDGLVIGFTCHDGVNPTDATSNPRSLIAATRAQALGARAFTLSGGMDAWVTDGFAASTGAPTSLNSVAAATGQVA